MAEEISPLENQDWWINWLRKDAKSKLEERIMTEQPTALRLADALDRWHEGVFPEEAAAELRRLYADAERYRYLRNRNPQEILPVIGNAAGVWIDCDDENGVLTLLTGEDADAAIDAAMGKT